MQLPKGKTLYDILELKKDEVEKDNTLIKKAYLKLALQHHPDKQPVSTSSSSDPKADTTHQFQLVGYAYTILSDSSKRLQYDLTGDLEEHNFGFYPTSRMDHYGQTWTSYFMDLMEGVVNEETLEAHALKYKGSAEEEQDVLKHYTEQKGNMNHILAYIPHSKATDVPRFMNIIKSALDSEKVESYPAYSKTTTKSAQYRRIKKEEKEAREMEQHKQNGTSEMGKGKRRQQENPDDKHDGGVVTEPLVETVNADHDHRCGDKEPPVGTSVIGQDPSTSDIGSILTAALEKTIKEQKNIEINVEEIEDQEDEVTSTSDNTENKKPLEPETKTSSHRHDATKTIISTQNPTRSITTRSMTRTSNQQKQMTAKNTRGSVKTTSRKKTVVTKKKKMHRTVNRHERQQVDETTLDSNASPTESPTPSHLIRKTKRLPERSRQPTRRLRPRKS